MSLETALWEGLKTVLTWNSLLLIVVGVTAGFIVGALPGFSSSNAVAVLLPFTVGMPSDAALILMAALYCGAQYGGAVPAILVNAPGEAGGAATALDGYVMAQRGEAGKALGLARAASAFGGVIAALIVLPIIGPLSKVALKIGEPELFVIAVFGLSIIVGVVGKNIAKGLAAGALGLLIATVSADPALGLPRMSFGLPELYEGVPFAPAVIGLFAFAELIDLVRRRSLVAEGATLHKSDSWREAFEGARLTFRYPGTLLRSTLIGLFVGIVPGIGASVSNFISYGEARRWSKHPERFGTGIPEGVIASEAADNGVTAGAMVPTFALGVPGSSTTAIMLAALLLHGVNPGPEVMDRAAPTVYAVVITLIVASLAILPLGLWLSEGLKQLIYVPIHTLVPGVIAISLIGAYAVRNSMFDVGLALGFGVLGYWMRELDYPVVPLVLGLVLGPIAEGAFVRSLMLSRGSYAIFFKSPITIVLWTILFLTLVVQPLVRHLRHRAGRKAADENEQEVAYEGQG